MARVNERGGRKASLYLALACGFALGLAVPAEAGQDRKAVTPEGAPAPIAPYSPGILVGDTLYLSGQIGLDPATGKFASEEIKGQTEQVLRNLASVLAAAGMTMDDAVQAQVFLADMNDYSAMNEVYGRWFKVPPARAAVQVARLPRDARVEIMLIAVRKKK